MTKNISENLKQLISEEKGSWLEDAQYRADNKKWIRRSQAIALTVLRALRTQGINQKILAERMGVSAQQVNKWVKGKENFTLETIAKLEDALEIELMSVPDYGVKEYAIPTSNLKNLVGEDKPKDLDKA
jgi:ribosome-binding protein aMBF1 (putative translation factor)